MNNLPKAFGIRNSALKLRIVEEEKNFERYNEYEFRKQIFVDPSGAYYKKISSTELKLVFRVISKFYKSYLRFWTSNIDYVNGSKCYILWHIWNRFEINLFYLIMTRMIQARDNKRVAYGMLITRLFKHLKLT